MAFWNREKPYDRTRILDAAEKARSRGRNRKAISEYRKVLAVDPADPHVNARIAPLLAKEDEHEAALKAFETGAESFMTKGFRDKGVAVYLQAAAVLPYEERLWTRIAELNSERGRKADAVNALVRGADHMKRNKSHRLKAISLLERALHMEPFHLHASLNVAQLLAKEGRKQDALVRLEALAQNHGGAALKKIRGAQFRIAPGPITLWRWFKAGRERSSNTLPSSVAQR